MKKKPLFTKIEKGTYANKHICPICKHNCRTAKGLMIHQGKTKICKAKQLIKGDYSDVN